MPQAERLNVQVIVNGTEQELDAGCSLAALLLLLEVRGRFAVEIDGELVPRSQHAHRRLRSGERVEIVQAIGGG